MAKKNKSKDRNSSRSAFDSDAMTAALVAVGGDILARVLASLSKEGIAWLSPQTAEHGLGGDATRKILRTLAEDGGQSLEELLESAGVPLGTLLMSLHAAQTFGLVEYDRESEQVSLTEPGRRMAQNVRKSGIREAADRLLTH